MESLDPTIEFQPVLHFRSCGLPCIVRLSGLLGVWCGYVGLSSDHPFFGFGTDELPAAMNPVHGAVTHAGHLGGEDPEIWWLGFDAGHANDVAPGLDALSSRLDPEWERLERRLSAMLQNMRGLDDGESERLMATFKTQAWVRSETERLAAHLAAAATKVDIQRP